MSGFSSIPTMTSLADMVFNVVVVVVAVIIVNAVLIAVNVDVIVVVLFLPRWGATDQICLGGRQKEFGRRQGIFRFSFVKVHPEIRG